jgi:hypothetical protein
VLEYDSVFCANTECALYVKPRDVNVKGNGNWAETTDGVITGRQRVGTIMLCDQCAARLVRGELTVRRAIDPHAINTVGFAITR